MASLMLTKHHGLGNDFLIAVDPDQALGPEQAIRWCDRRRGMGADGLIAAVPRPESPLAWTMHLWNADGSRAELSGNGLRCLGQAILLQHPSSSDTVTYDIHTDAGLRTVEVTSDGTSHTDLVTVDMGQPRIGPPAWSRWPDLGVNVVSQIGVDLGNPHLVCRVEDPSVIDLAKIGPVVESDYPKGLNIEFIATRSRTEIELVVWERGVGITQACGSGACAGAWAAGHWGLVDVPVAVTMPGGSASVRAERDRLLLTGPATFVAVVELEHS